MSDLFKYDVKFWEKLEVRFNGAIPAIIKHILRASGFENLLSLRDLTKDDMDEIDNFVNSDLKPWLKILRKSDDDYAKLKVFKLLPGHRKIILKISGELRMHTENDIVTKSVSTSTQTTENASNVRLIYCITVAVDN